ncbi:MAG: sigma-70 family RNA polymerase sigma factor [Prevotella sp.]|nr:sigma-70 family RNA polymerase sigma factor [Prevotella sp.]
METEQQLLQAISRGERQALRRLYERYADFAMAVGLRYVPRSDEVRDVLQDSFVKILTQVSRFSYRGEGSLKSWVGRIVANRAIDYVKERERLVLADQLPDTPDEPEPDDPEVEKVPPDVLTQMIGQLPAGYRLVFNLHVFEHCPHSEIARQLGIKENSSASQFFRARKMLARMINEYIKKQRL